MNAPSCRETYPVQALTAYWLGELEDPAENELEEHLFGCEECTRRLNAVAQLGEGVKRLAREGNVRAILTAPFVERLKELGVRVREYRMSAGGSVECTITPEDDLVVAHLHASLQEVRRLDMVLHGEQEGVHARIEDVAFDPAAGEVVMLPNAMYLRQLNRATLEVKLVAVDAEQERVIGEYTFNHSPHR